MDETEVVLIAITFVSILMVTCVQLIENPIGTINQMVVFIEKVYRVLGWETE